MLIQLTGEQLAIALQRTTKPIDLRDSDGQRIETFEPGADIMPYIVAGYTAHGTTHRVKHIRPPVPVAARRPELPFEPCYLNQAAPVIRFWADQVSPGYGSTFDSFV